MLNTVRLCSSLLLLGAAFHARVAIASPPAPVNDARVAAESPGRDWLVKGGGLNQQHYSPLTLIDSGNVARLGVAC